jgi:hypothetical protein
MTTTDIREASSTSDLDTTGIIGGVIIGIIAPTVTKLGTNLLD